MTAGFSRRDPAVDREIQPVAIVAVDVIGRTATALTRSRNTINVITSYAVGDAIITPAIGEQWYVERFDMDWRLYGRLPFNDATLLVEPVEGQVSVGSAKGPLELNGTQVNVRADLVLGLTHYRDNNGALEHLVGEDWVPVAVSAEVPETTDDLPEGVDNLYFTVERAADAAPVQDDDTRLTNTRTPTDNTVTTAKIVTANVTLAKLEAGVQTSLGKADTALQSIAANTITNTMMADDAIGIAELSATGTPDSTTYLRGDNSWATVPGGTGQVGATMTRTATGNVNASSSAAGTLMATSFFGNDLFHSADITHDLTNGKFTVSIAGLYLVILRYKLNFTAVGAPMPLLAPVLFKNTSVYQFGNDGIESYDSGTGSPSAMRGVQGIWIVPLSATDTVQAGYSTAAAYTNALTGEAAGAQTFFSIALLTAV